MYFHNHFKQVLSQTDRLTFGILTVEAFRVRVMATKGLLHSLQSSRNGTLPPCLTLSNIRYVSRVKLSNPGKGVAPSLTLRCSSYWRGSLLVALDYGRQLDFFTTRLQFSVTLGPPTFFKDEYVDN